MSNEKNLSKRVRPNIEAAPWVCDEIAALESRLEAAEAEKQPLHGDDKAVDVFATAMKEKLAAKRAEGYSGWDDEDECSVEYLAELFISHLPKGDMIDVANFAMMLWHRPGGTGALGDILKGSPGERAVYEQQLADAQRRIAELGLRLESVQKCNLRDGKWLDDLGCCRVCGGEIPYGHTSDCDYYKLEKRLAEAGWQPIETAPKDNKRPLYLAQFDEKGTLIDIDFDCTWESEIESWEAPNRYYYWASAHGNIEEPTHWAYQDAGAPPQENVHD